MGRKSWKKRNEHQLAQDRKQESVLRRQGKSLRDIADELGISYEMVRQDLAFVNRQIISSAKEDLDQLKSQIAAKLRLAQTESLIAWKHSQEPLVKEVTKQTDDGIETTITIFERSGNQGFIKNYLTAVDKEAKLFDLYKSTTGDNIDLTELEQELARQLKESEKEYGSTKDLPVQSGAVPIPDPIDSED